MNIIDSNRFPRQKTVFSNGGISVFYGRIHYILIEVTVLP